MRMASLAVGGLLYACAPQAVAQTAEPVPAAADGAAGEAGDDIVVTGQKVARSVQDTPVSVGVVGAEEIASRSLFTIDDALAQVANVTPGIGGTTFSIRGIDAFNVTGSGDGALASVYLDGAALPRRAISFGPVDLWDIAQVEVYRGPQSTLQGRNALAGAVVIRSTDPTFRWSGRGRLQLSAPDGARRGSLALGGPIVADQLAFRVSADLSRSDGFVRGETIGRRFDPRATETVRGKLLLTPQALPDLKVVVALTHARNIGGISYVEFDPPYSRWDRISLANERMIDRTTTDLATLDLGYDLGAGLTLSSVTNRNTVHWMSSFDNDWSKLPLNHAENDETTVTISQETRLTLDRGPLTGVLGGYYSDEDNSDANARSTQTIGLQAVGIARRLVAPRPAGLGLTSQQADYVLGFYPNGIGIATDFRAPLRTRNLAAFGDGRWQVAPVFALLGGFRWDRERQQRAYVSNLTLSRPLPDPASVGIAALRPVVAGINAAVNGLIAAAGSSFPEREVTFQAFLPKGGAEVRLARDVTLSAIVQRGYRSGGSGTNTARSSFYTFEPEYTWNYELALRSQWFDRRLTVNANLFRIDWSDQQVRVELTPGNVYDAETRNAGGSRLQGFEVELRGRPTNRLDLSAGVGHTETRFTRFVVDGADYGGRAFTNAPDWTANAVATWRAPAGLLVNGNVAWRSGAFATLDDQSRRDLRPYMLVGGRIGWQGEHVGAFVFATNLLDERYNDVPFTTIAGTRVGVVGEPRVVGMSLEGRF